MFLLNLCSTTSPTSNISKWLRNQADCVENVDLTTRIKASLEEPFATQEAAVCLQFLQRAKKQRVTPAEIEDFEQLLAAASNEFAESRQTAKKHKRSKRTPAKRKK